VKEDASSLNRLSLLQMFDNCRRYNDETTQFYKCADDVQRWFRYV